MPEDLILPVSKTTETTENLGVTLRKLTLEVAASGSAGTLAVELAPLDENGAWLSGVSPVVIRREDGLFETDPRKRYAASSFHALILNAKINPGDPSTAGFIAMLRAAGHEVTEQETVRDFAKMIIPLIVASTPAPAPRVREAS